MRQRAQRGFGVGAVTPNLLSDATDARHYAALMRNVFFMVPTELTTDELIGFHGTNERVLVSSLLLVARFHRELVRGADGDL
jgi:carboxypeptidase PM20D1